MTDLPKYHLSEQRADVLLGPVGVTLRELERRLQHYADRLTLAEPDLRAIRAARDVLAEAHGRVERLSREAAATERAR